MDLLPDDEQREISDAIGAFLRENLPIDRLRNEAYASSPREIELWPALAELGIFGLTSAQTLGGSGYSIVEAILVARQAGVALLSPSVLATMVAADLAEEAQQHALARSIIAGDARAAFAIEAEPREQGQRCDDVYVLDSAGTEIVVLTSPRSLSLLRRASLTDLRVVEPVDETVDLRRARTTRSNAIAEQSIDAAVALRMIVLLAGYLCGIADASREMAVEYAKVREQFGQPIGAFQAVKHRCADMEVRNQVGWAQTVFAALATRDNLPERLQEVAAAKLLAREAALLNGAANIQVHGGIGITAEAHPHRYLKRAHLFDQLAGSNQRMKRTLLALEGAR
jgi:alkylation response protein AidB-like acyl-CoA dehydrogenase